MWLDTLTIYSIRLLHLLFIIFVVVTPFTNYITILGMHFITIPFLILHWILNNDVCFLTEIEHKLSNKPRNKTFFGRLIQPVYRFNQQFENHFLYTVTIMLWLITLIKIISLYIRS